MLYIPLMFFSLLFVYWFSWKPKRGDEFYCEHPLWFAHRGNLVSEPENTVQSFTSAIHKGMPAVELDVVSTKDGVVVCSHNFDLERKTNGFGYIHKQSHEDIKQVLVNHSAKIPTLEEAMDVLPDPVRINVEVKTSQLFAITTALSVAKMIKKRRIQKRTMISCFNPFALACIKLFYPSILTGYLFEEWIMFPFVYIARADFLHPRGDLVTENLLRFSRQKGMRINAWTINNKPAIDWLKKQGADGIITDRLEFYKA